jgi:hypothetical protein
MAELRNGCDGALVPDRRSAGHRGLLPFEVELCQTLGIEAEEYFYFQQLSDAYNGKRAAEYDLAGVPDVSNGPVVPILINLAIGIALSAIGALLAPKPSNKTPPQLKTADKNGAKRYLQSEGFSSVQDVAALGSTIPLVFANRRNEIGGVRVNAMLLWSQLLSRGTGQQLKAAMLLSLGRLAERPDFEGYAIGDQTLKNYTNSKLGLYYRPYGGRLLESDRYPQGTIESDPSPNDILTVYSNAAGGWQPWFSGTRTPSTQTQFGVYNPLPNGNAYKVAYELVMTGKDAESKQKEADRQKREKIAAKFEMRASFDQTDSEQLSAGQLCRYKIGGGKEDKDRFKPWGLDDVNGATEEIRAAADEQLQVGDTYLAGDAMVVCIARQYDEPWDLGKSKHYTFRCIEPGRMERRDTDSKGNEPYGFILQRLAVATIANSRDCDITELGIKSTVWRQISGFPNVNSEPSDETIDDYEDDNGSITLGNLNRYNRRLSFFRLEWRRLGTGGNWADLTDGRLFCVEGRTPTAQYNFIRIEHARGQYEFRLLPVPGARVIRSWREQVVYQLGSMGVLQFQQAGLSVSFSGRRRTLDPDKLTNPDWYVKGKGGQWITRIEYKWSLTDTRYQYSSDCSFDYKSSLGKKRVYASYEGGVVELGKEYDRRNGGDYQEKRKYKFERGAARDTRKVGLYQGNLYIPQQRATVYEIQLWEYGPHEVRTFVDSECLNLYDVVSDFRKYDAENASHFDGPEHEVVYVNEQVKHDAVQYDELSYVGLRLNSTKEWSSFQQLSAYVKRGVMIERLIDDSGNPVAEGALNGASNNLAEIAYALLVDKRIGAGASVGRQAVSRERMQEAARWCHTNQFTWDGVIGDPLNLRQWIYEQAGYCLLDFTILGGQFSLVPSFPHDSSYRIARAAKPKISALFTDGNIRDLKVAWLSPEERQLFKAVVKWRQESDNGFSRTRSLTIRLSDAQGGRDLDPEEDFDLSEFCTSAAQARTFARTALKLRQKVTHGLTFETTPQAAMGLEPGAYFRLVSEVTHTSRFSNGTIADGGLINSAQPLTDGVHKILYWVPGTEGVKEASITVKAGTCSNAAFWGTVFTVANSTTTSRVYKVETLAMGQEGFVTVSGSHQPLTDTGGLAVLDWNDGHFVEEGA